MYKNKLCLECGKTIIILTKKDTARKFCSRSCSCTYRNKNYKKTEEEKEKTRNTLIKANNKKALTEGRIIVRRKCRKCKEKIGSNNVSGLCAKCYSEESKLRIRNLKEVSEKIIRGRKWDYISDVPSEVLLSLLQKMPSLTFLIIKLGFSTSGDKYKSLKKACEENNLMKEYEEIKERGSKNKFRIINEDVFTKNSRARNKKLRRIILEENLLDYKCSECGVGDIYNGKDITLHIHHINGEKRDNRLKNLTFLCPNCHSQTDNFGSKNMNK